MAAPTKITPTSHRLAERLRPNIEGEVLFDAFSRGRYSTDASMYQIEPVGVVVPKTEDDVRVAARDRPRGRRVAAAARRRHLAVGADGRPLAGDRLHQAPEPADRGGCRGAHGHRAARHRAGRAEPPAQGDGPLVSGRRLDLQPRHHRRHDRQQLVRHALDPLRHHARQRAGHRCDPAPTAARPASARLGTTSLHSRDRIPLPLVGRG